MKVHPFLIQCQDGTGGMEFSHVESPSLHKNQSWFSPIRRFVEIWRRKLNLHTELNVSWFNLG